MEMIKKGDVPPYNTFKGGMEALLEHLKFKRRFQIFAKKKFEEGAEERKKRLEPKEYKAYTIAMTYRFDLLIQSYEDSIKKIEEILWRTGHLTFQLRKCKKCLAPFPPMDSITRFCFKHREVIKSEEGDI